MIHSFTNQDLSGPGSYGAELDTLHVEPRHQMQFSVIPRTPVFFFGGGVDGLTPLQGVAISVFQAPSTEWFISQMDRHMTEQIIGKQRTENGSYASSNQK